MRLAAAYSNKDIKGRSLRDKANCTADLSSSYESEDGAVVRNIEACRAISQTVQTSLGPYGRNKIVINHLQKMILTSDAASILKELDVVHPAAKLVVMASQQQEAEMGDATNLVIVLAGEILKKAEELLRMGLKTSEIVKGFELAMEEALRCLNRTSQPHWKEEIVTNSPRQNLLSTKSKTFDPKKS